MFPRSAPAPAQVRRLPKVNKYLVKNCKTIDSIPDYECAICLENYNIGDKVNTLKCNDIHTFHHTCMLEWVKTNDICPMCRENIL